MSSYSHRFHAGNVGDVWKHVVWTSLLMHLTKVSAPLHVVETHAGEGVYKLPPVGEWQAGVGRVCAHATDAQEPEALRAFFHTLDSFPRGMYPGSPLFTLARLRADDTASFYELDPQAHAQLQTRVHEDTRAEAPCGDGVKALHHLAPAGHGQR